MVSLKPQGGLSRWLLLIEGVGLCLFACAPIPLFPPEVIGRADPTVTFQQVLAQPAEYEGRVVEFGGQIVGSMVEGEAVHLLVRELPIQTTPVYGPVETDRPRGMFVIRYQGAVGAQDIQYGNMIVVIGTMIGALSTDLTGSPVRRPTVSAECFHVWRTQGRGIDEFPWLPNARYWPLIQQTYCVNTPNTILTVS